MMIHYEYRAQDNPVAMPLGNYTISRHLTETAARRAWAGELRGLRHIPGNERAWLGRVIVRVDGVTETAVSSGPQWIDDNRVR